MTEAPKPKSIKVNVLWNSAGSLTNLGCQWLITILIVRLSSGYDAAGIYSLAITTYNIFGSIAQYRMYTYQISDVKRENSTGEYLAFRLITSTATLLLCSIYGIATCDQSTWAAIALYAAYKTIALLIDVFHACDQQNHRMDYIGISLALQGVLTLGAFAAIFTVSQSVEMALIGMTISIAAIGLFYDFGRTKQFGKIKFGINRKKTFHLLVSCLPIVIAGIAAAATSSLPRQTLANLMGNETLGIYASVAAPVAIIQMGASYIYNPMLSYFSELYADGNINGFAKLFAKAMSAIFLIGAVCVLGFALLGEWLLILLFGESIAEHVYLLVPLVAFAVITGIQWFLNDLLIALRKFKATFISSVVSLAAALLLETPFILGFGPNGVTFVGLVACAAGIAIMVIALTNALSKTSSSSQTKPNELH